MAQPCPDIPFSWPLDSQQVLCANMTHASLPGEACRSFLKISYSQRITFSIARNFLQSNCLFSHFTTLAKSRNTRVAALLSFSVSRNQRETARHSGTASPTPSWQQRGVHDRNDNQNSPRLSPLGRALDHRMGGPA